MASVVPVKNIPKSITMAFFVIKCFQYTKYFIKHLFVCIVVCLSQQFFSHVKTVSPLPGSIEAASSENWIIAYMQKQKAQISCALTAQLISAFVFASRIVQITSIQYDALTTRPTCYICNDIVCFFYFIRATMFPGALLNRKFF